MYTSEEKLSILLKSLNMYRFLYQCEFFVCDPREWRWIKAMNMVSGQFCLLPQWIPMYSGLIGFTEIVILSWHGFFFLNPETEEYLKESESWNTLKQN